MKLEDKTLAEKIFSDLLVGRHFCGIHFYAGQPIILIDDYNKISKLTTAYLTIESHWEYFDECLSKMPSSQEEISRKPVHELAKWICRQSEHSITKAYLDSEKPHLFIKLSNEKTFFVNGSHDNYESWNINVGKFTIVAIPGEELAIWSPDDYDSSTG